jgi:hypothetical protein
MMNAFVLLRVLLVQSVIVSLANFMYSGAVSLEAFEMISMIICFPQMTSHGSQSFDG